MTVVRTWEILSLPTQEGTFFLPILFSPVFHLSHFKIDRYDIAFHITTHIFFKKKHANMKFYKVSKGEKKTTKTISKFCINSSLKCGIVCSIKLVIWLLWPRDSNEHSFSLLYDLVSSHFNASYYSLKIMLVSTKK